MNDIILMTSFPWICNESRRHSRGTYLFLSLSLVLFERKREKKGVMAREREREREKVRNREKERSIQYKFNTNTIQIQNNTNTIQFKYNEIQYKLQFNSIKICASGVYESQSISINRIRMCNQITKNPAKNVIFLSYFGNDSDFWYANFL
jgi:hypothetical protein